MATTYEYSISAEFPGGVVGVLCLQDELKQSSLAGKYVRIDTEGDTIKLVFSSALTAGEKTTLDGDTTGPAGGLIAAHNASGTHKQLLSGMQDHIYIKDSVDGTTAWKIVVDKSGVITAESVTAE